MFHNRISRRRRRSGLLRNADFVNLWAAESISQFGAQITLLALPLAAAISLDASAGQMGVLAAAGTLPVLLFGLFAGVWVDRLRRRPLLIAADIGRAALLLIVPLAWYVGALRIELLFVVAFLVGVLTVVFDVAYLSYLPSLVARDDIIDANSKLQASVSTAQVVGPGLAGVLVGWITAPWAILVQSFTFLASALFIGRIRAPEPAPHPAARADAVRASIAEGVRVVWNHRLLRPMVLSASGSSFFGYVFLAVYVLYMVRDLGFSPGAVGLVLGLGGVGALIGALLAAPLAQRIGVGPSIVLGRALFGVGGLAVVAAFSVPGYEVQLVLFAEFFQWLVLVVADVNQVSLRQAAVPARLLGRVTATFRFAAAGVIPLGSLAGGLLGDLVGLRGTLLVGVFGMLLACLFVVVSPLRGLRTLPDDEHQPAAQAVVDSERVTLNA